MLTRGLLENTDTRGEAVGERDWQWMLMHERPASDCRYT